MIKVDPSLNDHRVITFHDSCNVARASRMGDEPGGQFTIPREIIKSVANNFHDMADGTIHEATFCCGGGGGLLTDDLMEVRVKGAFAAHECTEQRGQENTRSISWPDLRDLQGAVHQGFAHITA